MLHIPLIDTPVSPYKSFAFKDMWNNMYSGNVNGSFYIVLPSFEDRTN